MTTDHAGTPLAAPPRAEARAFAPATLSNLGTGFDVLGLSLCQPGDTVTARLVPGAGVRVVRIEGDGGRLPTDATRNTAGIAATTDGSAFSDCRKLSASWKRACASLLMARSMVGPTLAGRPTRASSGT